MNKRTSGAQLPSEEELMAISKHESSRQVVRFDFLTKNDAIFDAYRELARIAGMDITWVKSYPSLKLDELVAAIDNDHRQIAAYITKRPDLSDLYARVYESLIPPQDTSPSDVIFVFGTVSNARIERAVELFKDGVAPKIILSGNRPFYSDDGVSEAARMAQFAIIAGIPESALILEKESITIPDNVKRSIDLLESLQWKPQSITIIATNFVLQRARMDWYKFIPWEIVIKPVAAYVQSERFTADGWYRDSEVTMLVLNEYAKLVIESRLDLIRRDTSGTQQPLFFR